MLTATMDEGVVYVLDKKEHNTSPNSERARGGRSDSQLLGHQRTLN